MNAPIDPANDAARRPRVLVADDHPQLRERVVSLLADDFTVIGTVSNGPELIDAEATLRPDVVIVDISMPGMSGLEATGRMRRRGSQVAVVYLTAHHEEDVLEAAWKSGALGFVTKTAIVRDLVLAVRAALEGRRFPAVPATLDPSPR